MAFVVTFAIGYASGAEETGSAPGKTFAWESQNMHFYDASRFGDDTIKEQLETAIVAGLKQRGLRFVSSVESAELELSYVVVLENEATQEEVAAFRQANPNIVGPAEDMQKFEEGMLYAKLVNKGSGEKVWDNTYRGMTALDMPGAPRRERMDELITEFLSTYTP